MQCNAHARSLEVITNQAPSTNNLANLPDPVSLERVDSDELPLAVLQRSSPPYKATPFLPEGAVGRCNFVERARGRKAFSNVNLLEQFAEDGKVIEQWLSIS